MEAAEKRARAADLAGRYTATDLAGLVVDLEAQLVGVRVKLAKRSEALRTIAGREWTEDGAVKVAQEALNA